jgi:predicted GNAT family acetyltransferase
MGMYINMSMKQGLEYRLEGQKCVIRYQAPDRAFSDFRTEANNDAVTIKNTYGQVYVLFSSGVDSQVIARTFLDMGVDAEYVFLNSVGYSDVELAHVRECEKFFGFKVRVVDINIDEHKDEWVAHIKTEHPFSMYHYPFEWLSQHLDGNYPIITQGANDPAIIGSNSKVISIYCNYFETMQQRFRMMGKSRQVIDFPFSPETIASYYTDDIVKAFCNSIQYYHENKLSFSTGAILKPGDYWNYYGKGLMKAKHFKNDIIWYGKLSGYERYPIWFKDSCLIKETKVTVPYWDLVEFLENNRTTYKDYSEWIYGEDSRFVSMNSDVDINGGLVVKSPNTTIAPSDHVIKYLNYDYVLYSQSNVVLIAEYEKMFEKYRHEVKDYTNRPHPHAINSGALLSKNNEVIAGIFFHTASYKEDLIIKLAYVNSEHRGNGIHEQLHKCVDVIAKSQNRKKVYSTILSNNKEMMEHAGPKIGYKTVHEYSLVYREISYD